MIRAVARHPGGSMRHERTTTAHCATRATDQCGHPSQLYYHPGREATRCAQFYRASPQVGAATRSVAAERPGCR